ncbi:MAG: MucB/RseB C-terminal domain-containing protein [Arenimonas sp.]
MLRFFIGVFLSLCALNTQAQSAASKTEKLGWLGQAKAWVSEKFNHEDASDWLKRIGPSLRRQNYQGTLVMVAEGRIDTMAVFHAFDKDRERERIVALSGPPREVIRDNKVVVSTNSKDGSVGYETGAADRWNPSQQFALADNLDGYEAKLEKTERIANFETQVIEIRARDKWRYGYRLWLEKVSGFPMRIDLLDENGATLEKMAFTNLQLGMVPRESDLAFPKNTDFHRVQSMASNNQADPGWRVKSPPEGFELRAARSSGNGVHLLYSDGLAFVSVYIERAPQLEEGKSAMQRGAVNVFAQWSAGRRVTVIGKVPARTVAQFSELVAPPK